LRHGDFAEDVVEHQPSGRRQRDARSRALEVTRSLESLDALPVDHRLKAETLGNPPGIDALAKAEAHDQRFVGGFERRQRRLFGDPVAVALER